MTKNIHAGHRERMKERFVSDGGLEGFNDHQVLEMLLFYTYARQDTNEIAHRMINEFGTLYNLMETSPKEISNRCKVSMNVAVMVSLIPHMAKRYQQGKWQEKALLNSVQKVGEYAKTLFVGKTLEHFYLICLDNQRRLIYSALVSKGSLTEIMLYPRNIVVEALKHQACSVILAHNHPSGSIKPSREDIDATYALKNALESVEIELLDHIVVGGEKYYSFSERGRLDTVY